MSSRIVPHDFRAAGSLAMELLPGSSPEWKRRGIRKRHELCKESEHSGSDYSQNVMVTSTEEQPALEILDLTQSKTQESHKCG